MIARASSSTPRIFITGTGAWDRDVWHADVRDEVLRDLLSTIHRLKLPVITQHLVKRETGEEAAKIGIAFKNARHKNTIMHAHAVVSCMAWADRWLERFAPDENAIVTAENRDGVREMIKLVSVIVKDEAEMRKYGVSDLPHLPIKRIIDGISFQGKTEAVALQLADVCAFTMMRSINGRHLPDGVRDDITSLSLATRMAIDDKLAEDIKARLKKVPPSDSNPTPSSLGPSS